MIIARFGTEYDHDPKAIMPVAFSYFVGEYPEDWNDEAVVLHNPYAKHPLPPEFFGNTPQDVYKDGNVSFFCYGRFIFASVTEKRLCPENSKQFHKAQFALKLKNWLMTMGKERRMMEEQVVEAHREQASKE